MGGLPASQEWCQEQLCQGMVLLCTVQVGAEQVMASPGELAEEQQWGQQAASVAHHHLQRGWGPWPHVLVFLSLLLIRKSEQVSACYSHILFCHTNTAGSNCASTQLLHARGERDSKHRSYDMKTIAAISGSSLFLGLIFVDYLPNFFCKTFIYF